MSKDYTFENPLMTDEEAEFASLLGDSATPAFSQRVSKGDMVTGRLISISREVAFVDLGGKAEGIIESSELEDLDLKPGDELEAMVLSTRGEIRLSRTLAGAVRDKELLEDAYRMGLPVEGRIDTRNKGGFDVLIGNHQAFLPVSHLDLGSVEDLDAWIGRTERFKIIEFDDRGKKTVVSRANLLREERNAMRDETWAELAVGQTRTGTVRSIADFGCFVDLGGVDGLVHVKEMMWGRFGHPSDLVEVGQNVTVTVVSIDRDSERVGLSMKSADGDPWKQVGTEITVGSEVNGQVTRVEKYGAFVELLPGLEGLIHVSELTMLKRIRHARDIVSVGDTVKVTVLEIDKMQQRIALSMKQLEDDPWADATSRFPIGKTIDATVERTAGFGVFLTVAPGVTGLLPRTETDHAQGVDLGRFYREADVVRVVILSVDPDERRMTLSISAISDAEEAANAADYNAKQPKGTQGMGTFADLLKNVNVKK